MVAIEVPTDEHAQARARTASALLADLQQQASEADRVVPGDDALFLMMSRPMSVVLKPPK
jgi:hypothetical protein